MQASLSNHVLFAEPEELSRYLNDEPIPLDVIDEYGYTPLIQAALINDIQKVKILLEKGANPNFSDLSGRTALHWAAENQHEGLVRLLLSFKADPNLYTVSGQPILVMPYLSQACTVKDLLIEKGGNLDVAKDFIMAKSLGHRFELSGSVDILDDKNHLIEIPFDGFYLNFTLLMIRQSLEQFQHHYAARKLRTQFDLLDKVIVLFKMAEKIAEKQHYLSKLHLDIYAKELDQYFMQDPILLPIAYEGHAIVLCKMGSYLVRCDRGVYGRTHGTVIVYRIGNMSAWNAQLVQTLLYESYDKSFIETDILNILGLKVFRQLPLPPQLVGNCSWSNVEAAVFAMLFLFYVEENTQAKKIDFGKAEKKAYHFYQEWITWDKLQALHKAVDSISCEEKNRSIARATQLAAILFQCCAYHRAADIPVANKILAVFSDPPYRDILEAYVELFWRKNKTPAGKNLVQWMEDNGV